MQARCVFTMNGALVVITSDGRMVLTDENGDSWAILATGRRDVPFDIMCIKRGVKVDGVLSDT
jgi:hypothetical protein